jgi:hypothetical protein
VIPSLLEWWKQSGLKLEFRERVLEWAGESGKTETLDWWLSSGLELPEQYEEAMLRACEFGHVNVLEWWKNSGLQLKYDASCMQAASLGSHIHVLQWWADSGLVMMYTRGQEEIH